MTSYKNELTIDFGEVSYLGSREAFRVRLDSSKLSDLIDSAASAHRVYELMLIDRPGDVLDYVTVVIEAAPKRVTNDIQRMRDKEKNLWSSGYSWTVDNVPFHVFSEILNHDHWEMFEAEYPEPVGETEDDACNAFDGDLEDWKPSDEVLAVWRVTEEALDAWNNASSAWDDVWGEALEACSPHAPAMKIYAEQLLGFVRKAQKNLEIGNDHLLGHILSRVKSGSHPYDFLKREAAIAAESWQDKPGRPEHTEGFYQKLQELLCEPDLVSISYDCDDCDYKVLQILATEQRRRAKLTRHSPDHAMHICANVCGTYDVAWDAAIFPAKGAHGDLFIEGCNGLGFDFIKERVENRFRCGTLLGRHILTIKDEGDMQGFSKTSGDGWCLYANLKPNNRRLGLECIEDWTRFRPYPMGAVLSFEHGATLFDHEKTLFFVGEDVDTPAREVLAVLIADWEAHSGDPVLVVMGDTQPFEAQKCRSLFEFPTSLTSHKAKEQCHNLFEIPTSLTSHEAKRQWLSDLIRMELPWLDAIIAFDAPTWAVEELNRWGARTTPWSPWVVSSSAQKDLKASYVVQGDLAKALYESLQRATSTRSQRF